MADDAECVVCGTSDYEVLLRSRDRNSHGDIVRCPSCSHTYVNPMPTLEQISDYYNGLYSHKSQTFSNEQMALARQSMRGYVAALQKKSRGAQHCTFLDLGGGLGYYSQAAKESGMTSTLVDLDPCSIDFAKKHHNLDDYFLGTSEEFAATTVNKYDVVFLRHVIEHYLDPRALLQAASNLVSENGVVILETDNNRGIELLIRPGSRRWYMDLYKARYHDVTFMSLLQKRPFALDPPRHLHGFSIPNLQRLLESLNLRSTDSLTYRLGDPVYWPNVPDMKFRQVYAPLVKFNVRAVADNMIDYCTLPFRKCLAATGHASGLCIYARKAG